MQCIVRPSNPSLISGITQAIFGPYERQKTSHFLYNVRGCMNQLKRGPFSAFTIFLRTIRIRYAKWYLFATAKRVKKSIFRMLIVKMIKRTSPHTKTSHPLVNTAKYSDKLFLAIFCLAYRSKMNATYFQCFNALISDEIFALRNAVWTDGGNGSMFP